MPHQCTKCSKVYPDASEELLNGCECGSKFFYYIREAKLVEMNDEVSRVMEELDRSDMDQIESDIRELTGIKDAADPVILDLESVRVLNPGKFEIDIVNLFNKNRPMIYKLGEGKYIIDIESSLGSGKGKKKGNERRSRFMEIVDRDERERSEIEREERLKDGKVEGEGQDSEIKKVVIGSSDNYGDRSVDVDSDLGLEVVEDVERNENLEVDENEKKEGYLDLTDDVEEKDEGELE